MLFKITCLLFLTLLGFAVNAATYFEEGAASQGSQHLVNSAKQLDAQTITDYQDCIRPCLKPIYAQLRDVDKNRQATTGDIEAIFKTILILNYHGLFNIAEFSADDPCLREQFLAYKIMGVTCGVLMQEQMSLLDLQQRSLEEVRKDKTFDILTDSYVKSLIPTNAPNLVQHAEPTILQYKDISGKIKDYNQERQGVLLDHYDREETFKDLMKERKNGKAIYLVLGRGNRQPIPEGQKTEEGKEIVWVYLDNKASFHSTNKRVDFLWENFNGALSRILPTDFFDGAVFDWSVTKFVEDKLLTVIQIAKILRDDGSLFLPTDVNRDALLYYNSGFKYDFPYPSKRETGRLLWPCIDFSSQKLVKLTEEEKNAAYDSLYQSLSDRLKELFSHLFEETQLLSEDNWRFKLWAAKDKDPKFILRNPKKAVIQANPWYNRYYDF